MDDVKAIEAMLDDESAWEKPRRAPKKKSERRQRDAVVSVRLSPAELERIQSLAGLRGMTLGAYMRECALIGATQTPGFSFHVSESENTVRTAAEKTVHVNYWTGLVGAGL